MSSDAARVRRSRAAVVLFDGALPRALHYRTRHEVALEPLGFEIMSAAGDWIAAEALFDALAPGHARDRVAIELLRLMDAGLLVAEGTRAAARDERLDRTWAWGPEAGLFHFGIKNARYAGPEEQVAWIEQRVAAAPAVPLFATNEEKPGVQSLRPPDLRDGPLAAMARRRSYRGFADEPISLDTLADCLFAGLGVVGFVETPTPGEGRLPLKMTPSGGARNPYEGYVLARKVEGLAPGVYHYSGVDHTLGAVSEGGAPDGASMVGGQAWASGASAIVMLAARFERCMWKYTHPGGLRVVLIEAGHIAQNILLAASHHGLAAAPTCAISDSAAEEACAIDGGTEAVIYAVALGVRSPVRSCADPVDIIPNDRLRAW